MNKLARASITIFLKTRDSGEGVGNRLDRQADRQEGKRMDRQEGKRMDRQEGDKKGREEGT